MLSRVECHALAPRAGGLRIWVGVFDAEPVERLVWWLDDAVLEPGQLQVRRPLARVGVDSPAVITQTGVYDLPLAPGDRAEHRVRVRARWADGREADATELRTRGLPSRVPDELNASFNVLLVSCFYGRNDSSGQAGGLVAHRLCGGPDQPDLVLTVGDQVYLDNPPYEALHLSTDRFAAAFEQQYRTNWQGDGFAQILRAAPVAGIPDDHEYWNNYPQAGAIWPSSWFNGLGRSTWTDCARAMFDAYQLAEPDVYCYDFDVAPLSFFLMDNRTFRVRAGFGERSASLRTADRDRFIRWVKRVLDDDELLPVLCTGPSLIQPAAGWIERTFGDRNFANYSDYPLVIAGLLLLSAAGRTPLLLTGDVHYPRVTRMTYAGGARGPGWDELLRLMEQLAGGPVAQVRTGQAWTELFEVISSPASLVAGSHKPSKPAGGSFDPRSARFRLDDLGTSLRCDHRWPTPTDLRDTRNHVTLLRFRATPTGATVEPTYWMINGPARARNPLVAPSLTLQRFPATVPVT